MPVLVNQIAGNEVDGSRELKQLDCNPVLNCSCPYLNFDLSEL